MFVLFFPVSTNTVRVLWGLSVLPTAIIVPVLFACITVIPESPGHGTKLCMQMHNTIQISSQCFWRSSQDILTSLKNQQKWRARVPPAPGHSLLPKTTSIAGCSHFYQTKSSHWSDSNELTLQKAQAPLSAAASTSQVLGQAQGHNWFLGWFWQGRLGG